MVFTLWRVAFLNHFSRCMLPSLSRSGVPRQGTGVSQLMCLSIVWGLKGSLTLGCSCCYKWVETWYFPTSWDIYICIYICIYIYTCICICIYIYTYIIPFITMLICTLNDAESWSFGCFWAGLCHSGGRQHLYRGVESGMLRSWSTLDQSRWFHRINHFGFGVQPQSIRIMVSLDLWFSHVNSEPTPLDDSMREGTISSMMSSAEDHGFQAQGSRLLRFCPRTRSWGCRRDVFGATLEVSMLM